MVRTVPMARMAPMVLMVRMVPTEVTALGATGAIGETIIGTATITTKAGGEVNSCRKRDQKEPGTLQ
ncbi:hypothetical protein A5871_000252 [Enterococcus sp. 2F9_DIV0599]|nr:hypothetical protein A5870_001152 [Enterococcus sp. 2G9_DIV0600]OTO35720.1 hypothetical protein A5871_000252 [Enterococcus sp. 2F9_DIV0599]